MILKKAKLSEDIEKVDPAENNHDTSYLEQFKEWDKTEGKKARIADYRRLAELSEDDKITADNINEWALRNTCNINYNYPRDKMLEELLEDNEDKKHE